MAKYNYWQQIRKNFYRSRINRWAVRILYLLIFVAVFGDFLANDKPIYCQLEGQSSMPIFKSYAMDWGLAKQESDYFNTDWSKLDYDRVLFAPIPYSATSIDRKNMQMVSPFGQQNVKSLRWRHWLGTDEIGRDIAAGLIRGTRTALLVGIIAMSIATVIGLFFGLLAGYYGDDQFHLGWLPLLLMILVLPLALFYGYTIRNFQAANFGWEMLKGSGIFLGILVLAFFLGQLLNKAFQFKKNIRIPLDSLVMRMVEVVNSLPGLLLILAILAIVNKPSIIYVMVIIGLINWTGITRFIRAELLRIRQLEYIQAARALGFSDWRIILRHALPNGLRPILITISFGMAGAILLEAFLSFLGIGLPVDTVTWGSLMRKIQSNSTTGAWWIAVFPGMAIFITVTVFNLIGEGLAEALKAHKQD